VERDLDGVRLQVEHRGDLAGGQVGPVTERDQLAVAGLEPPDRAGQREAAERLVLELPRVRLVGDVDRELQARRPSLDATAGDSDQPRQRLALAGVVALPVPDRALERLARDVLGVRPVTDPVRTYE
jgi:hypothetical protein